MSYVAKYYKTPKDLQKFVLYALVFSFLTAFAGQVFAGTSVGVSYQGRILRPSGEPVNAGVVAFSLRVFEASNNCLLWSEVQNLNMAGSGGAFSLVVGAGTRTDGGSHTFKQVFVNAGTLSGLTCTSGSTFTPTSNEDRNLVVTFNDGGSVVALNPMPIKSVPFAMQADQVSGYGILNLAKISGAGSATTLTPFQFDFLAALANPASVSSAPCSTNEILKFDGTNWACAADATGGAPSDASYAAKGILQFNTDAATSGISIASGVASVNTGLAANQIPKLDASANLGVGVAPTSRLDVSGAITQRGIAAPAVSAAGTGRIYYDSTNNHFYYSENGGAYTQLSSATGALSSVSSVSNSGGDLTLAPAASTGAVLVNSGTASLGTTSGALVVTGGMGVSGSVNVGGSISSGATVSASTSVITPQIYGSSSASGILRLDGTSNATKGYVLLNSSGGNVGIGTASPGGILDVQGGTGAANTNGTDIYLMAQNGGAGASVGGNINLTPGAGGGGSWPAGYVNIAQTSVGKVLSVARHGSDSYVSSSGTLNSPRLNSSFSNSYSADGNSVISSYEVRNSSTNQQNAYFGAVSVTGAANYAPAFVWAQKTGTASYSERMRLDSNGNLGVGTASPSAIVHSVVTNATATALKAESIVNSTGSYSPTGLMVTGANTSTGTINTYRGILISNPTNSGGGTISQAYGLVIAPITSGGTNYAIYASGGQSYFQDNVGIGTSSPQSTLHVKLPVAASSSLLIEGDSTGGVSSPRLGFVDIKGGSVTTSPAWYFDNESDAFRIYRQSNISTIGTTFLKITNAGNVGIGSASPAFPLEVQDTTGTSVAFKQVSNLSAGASLVMMKARGTASVPTAVQAYDNLGIIGARGYGATGYSSLSKAAVSMTASENWTDTAQGTYLTLETTATGTTTRTERVRVDPSGNVGIKTTTPVVALDVNGPIRPGTTGIATGGACTAEGAFAYDMTAHAPVYCNASYVWAAMSGGGSSGLGVGQTWQDMTGSRSIGTTYTNSTGKPIVAAVEFSSNGGSGCYGTMNIGGVTVYGGSGYAAGGDYWGAAGHFIIPDSTSYTFTINNQNGACAYRSWAELR